MLINRPRVKVSRRGAFLATFGVVYALLGYSYLNVPEASKPLLHAYFRFALSLAPLEVYGWGWIACGLIAVAGGVWHRFDAYGFGAAAFMPVIWSIAYFAAQIDGVPRSWVSGVVFLLLATAITLVASMPDPIDVIESRRR